MEMEMGGEIGGRAKVYREVTGVDSENNKIWRHLKRGERCKKRENGKPPGKIQEKRFLGKIQKVKQNYREAEVKKGRRRGMRGKPSMENKWE
jgi:hypothetical protein